MSDFRGMKFACVLQGSNEKGYAYIMEDEPTMAYFVSQDIRRVERSAVDVAQSDGRRRFARHDANIVLSRDGKMYRIAWRHHKSIVRGWSPISPVGRGETPELWLERGFVELGPSIPWADDESGWDI
jgi:hypothetical protein